LSNHLTLHPAKCSQNLRRHGKRDFGLSFFSSAVIEPSERGFVELLALNFPVAAVSRNFTREPSTWTLGGEMAFSRRGPGAGTGDFSGIY
jgi:hypothetical protein